MNQVHLLALKVLLLTSMLRSTVFATETPEFRPTPFPTIGGLSTLLIAVQIVASVALIWTPSRSRLAKPMFALIAVSVVGFASPDPLRSALSLLPLLAVLLVGVPGGGATAKLERFLFRVALSFTVVSVVVYFVAPWASVGVRLQGVFANPNSAGAMAAMLVFAAARKDRFAIALVALGACAMTGSRTFGLAAAAVMIVFWGAGRFSARKLAVAVAAGAMVMWIAQTSGLPFARLGTGGRDATWAEGLRLAREGLPLGAGYSLVDVEVSNSILLLTAELGFLGLVIGAAVSILLVVRAISIARTHALDAVFAVSFVVGSMLEGWLLASGSFVALTFWTWIRVTAVEPSESRVGSGVGPPSDESERVHTRENE